MEVCWAGTAKNQHKVSFQCFSLPLSASRALIETRSRRTTVTEGTASSINPNDLPPHHVCMRGYPTSTSHTCVTASRAHITTSCIHVTTSRARVTTSRARVATSRAHVTTSRARITLSPIRITPSRAHLAPPVRVLCSLPLTPSGP